MTYRGVSYEVVRVVDVQICWRWIVVVNSRRKSGQTKISRRAAEIQAQAVIDRALAGQVRSAAASEDSWIEDFVDRLAGVIGAKH